MILHIDMDAFFASVEQRDRPELKGKCVIVGGRSNRGVVSAASYEARKFGVHSAMPVFQARRKCPRGIFVPPRMDRYRQVSRSIMTLLKSFSPLVEVVSIDEAYMDVAGCERLYGRPEEIGRRIKQAVRTAEDLSCSVGIAPNMFLAKVASDMDKPDGLTVIQEERAAAFIDALAIGKVPGVGRKTGDQLDRMGVKTLGDIRQFPEAMLVRRLGKFGRRLAELAAGIDRAAVTPHALHKSVSSEKTLSVDTGDLQRLKNILLEQAGIVADGLRKEAVRAKTITLKLRYADFQTVSKSTTLAAPVRSSEAIYTAAEKLLDGFTAARKIRLIGVGASGFVTRSVPVQQGLFEPQKASDRHWEKVDQALDRIKHKFGQDAIGRATLKTE